MTSMAFQLMSAQSAEDQGIEYRVPSEGICDWLRVLCIVRILAPLLFVVASQPSARTSQ